MTTAELFEKRKNDPRWNTSYPLNPKDWAIREIEEDKYFVMVTCNDELILTPSDIEFINSKLIFKYPFKN